MANALERTDLASSANPSAAEDDGRDDTGRQEAGEGIGLSIVKRLCDMLDATIELKSEPHMGTTFRILFPRHYNS
jgi:signal transduction histidine kinase